MCELLIFTVAVFGKRKVRYKKNESKMLAMPSPRTKAVWINNIFGYYSMWLVVNKARMDIVLPACCTFQYTSDGQQHCTALTQASSTPRLEVMFLSCNFTFSPS